MASVEDRALSLLGSGVPASATAAALGVSESRISQLLSDSTFKEQVTELRYNNLQAHNKRDNAYDTLEDTLLGKLEKSLAFMVRPGEILKAIQVVNGAKRRGQSAPEQIVNQSSIVNIVMPTQIVNKFVTNVNNQVIKAGDQELLTMPSGNLLSRVEGKEDDSATKQLPASQSADASKATG